jgi:hypothetical protein
MIPHFGWGNLRYHFLGLLDVAKKKKKKDKSNLELPQKLLPAVFSK